MFPMYIFFAPAAAQNRSVFSFALVYRAPLDKQKTLNVGAAAAKIECFSFYACLQDASRQAQNSKCWRGCDNKFLLYAYIQDASRQAQNSKCWRAASAKKLHFRDIAEEIYI